MSPPSNRAQKRQRRNMLVSVLIVIGLSLASFGGVFAAKWSPRLGLDLAGGLSVVYQTEHKVSDTQLQEAVNILNDRVNGLGVSGATVGSVAGTGGTQQIAVSIPGVKNSAQVLGQIGQTAQMYFRPVLCFAAPLFTGTTTVKGKKEKVPLTSGAATLPSCQSQYATTEQNIDVVQNSSVQGYTAANSQPDPQFATIKDTPTTVANYQNRDVLLPGIGTNGLPTDKGTRYVLGPEQMTGHAIGSALAQQSQTGSWEVNYTLAGSANSQLWDKVAQENFHQYLGIELDGVVYSAPIIQPAQAAFSSFQGQGSISGGSINQQDADQLAQAMQFGSLPVRLKQLTTETVSPTLGKSSLKAGLGAGIVGLLLVLLYVLFYYRALGLVVISGLALTAALLWA
ncbi:MAG TPA: hypothetical protein VGF87_02315, partial [Acidimicrobiales bacterium]